MTMVTVYGKIQSFKREFMVYLINLKFYMTYYCKLCDKATLNKSNYKHFKSKTHKALDISFMRRYIIHNPNFDQTDEIVKRYVNICEQKYEKLSIDCVLKISTTTNCVRYIRINTKPILLFLNSLEFDIVQN